MASKEYFLGEGSRFGFALNTVANGYSWDGAPDTLVWVRPIGGNMSFRYGRDQNIDPSNEVFPTTITQGGLVCSGTVQFFLSYATLEELLMMVSGGADSITGAGPYEHDIALDTTVMYGSFAGWWTDVVGTNEQVDVTNCAINQCTITHSAESRPILTIGWTGQDYSVSAPSAPALTALDLVAWEDLTFTLGSVARCINGYTLDLVCNLQTDDFGPDGKLCSILRTGQFGTSLSCSVGMDSTLETFLQAEATAITTNTINYDNGGAGAANRDFLVTLGDLFIDPIDGQIANIGKRQETLAFKAVDAAPFAFVTTNSRAAAAAQPV
jgi:hypothetical protein